MRDDYDIAIIGSGIAGSTIGLVLAKQGLRVLVVEKGKHPRFVIGESTVPSTSYTFEYIGAKYDIPEFRAFTHFTGLKTAGLTGWPKQHFWFGFHEPGKAVTQDRELTLFTLMPPRGPDVHTLRADLDHYLVKAFPKYGIDYLEETSIVDFEALPDAAVLTMQPKVGEKSTVRAQLVIDASGHQSFIAKKFGLRVSDPPFCTNTRSIFSHYTGVKFMDDFLEPNNEMGFIRDGGTVHHCFDGGWIWTIRFDDDVTSVGITLDRERWPLDESISPEEEVRQIIERYPTVKQVLGEAKAIRPLIRTGRQHGGSDRIQFSTKSIVGDRFVMTPHAAGFIDPLFSTGILLTGAFISRVTPLILAAKKDGNWSADRFRPIEQVFFKEISCIDKIVGGMFRAWKDDHIVFAHYWRLWIYTGQLMYLCRIAVPQESTRIGLYGAGIPTTEKLIDDMNAIVFDDKRTPAQKATDLKATMEAIWGPFETDWPRTPDKPIVVKWRAGEGQAARAQLRLLRWWRGMIRQNASLMEEVEHSRFVQWFWETRRRAKEHKQKLEASKAEGGAFHRAYDVFQALINGTLEKPLTGNKIWNFKGRDS
ncbi:MAG TPA: NAD(P)/FAD-dependent oxidoreductase [Kofleriaceae bacterium]|nr:NAD(P)/FAD-dependent oxidoreductase [Kofleriaceae bacterium]